MRLIVVASNSESLPLFTGKKDFEGAFLLATNVAKVILKVGKGTSLGTTKRNLLMAVATMGMVAAAPPVFATPITHEFYTPEPATLALFVIGLGALCLLVRLRKRKPRS